MILLSNDSRIGNDPCWDEPANFGHHIRSDSKNIPIFFRAYTIFLPKEAAKTKSYFFSGLATKEKELF